MRITAIELGKVLVRLLGIYVLLYVVSPLSFIIQILAGVRLATSPFLERQLIQLAMYLTLSGVLIFFGGQIMTRLAAKDRRGRLQNEAYEQARRPAGALSGNVAAIDPTKTTD